MNLLNPFDIAISDFYWDVMYTPIYFKNSLNNLKSKFKFASS